MENPLQFTGREWDAGPGLLYLRNRYYDPSIARFISQDPIGLSGGINPYTYADNSPVASRDPTGLDDDVCWTITYWEYSPRSGYRIIDQKTFCEGGGGDSGGSNWFEEWLNEDSEGGPDEYAACMEDRLESNARATLEGLSSLTAKATYVVGKMFGTSRVLSSRGTPGVGKIFQEMAGNALSGKFSIPKNIGTRIGNSLRVGVPTTVGFASGIVIGTSILSAAECRGAGGSPINAGAAEMTDSRVRALVLVMKWGSFLILVGLALYLLETDLPIWVKIPGIGVLVSLGGLALAQSAD